MQVIHLEEKQMLGIKPFIEPIEGAMIAGGAIRQWFTGGEKLNDIDIFFTSLDNLNKFIKNSA